MEKVREEDDIAGSTGQVNPVDRITPERARSILLEHGLEVSLEQADAILTFLRRLAIITLPQIF